MRRAQILSRILHRPISDFWQIGLTVQDPQIPNLPLETPPAGGLTEFDGLKVFYSGVVVDLSLVAEADAPAGMGGVLKINKNGTIYAVYLVETTDPEASNVRIRTSTGTKAIKVISA
jgi:hypothetical protein